MHSLPPTYKYEHIHNEHQKLVLAQFFIKIPIHLRN
jgi:hypothetical protein